MPRYPLAHFLRPHPAVPLQSLHAHVDARAAVLPVLSGQRVGVRTFERETVLPQRRLCAANLRRRRVRRRMVTDLRHHPRKIPRSAAHSADQPLHHTAVLRARDLMSRRLVCVRFALVPQQCAEPPPTQLPYPPHHTIEQPPVRFPFVLAHLRKVFGRSRRRMEAISLGQPLPHAGASGTDARHAHRHFEALVQRVAEGRDEAPASAAVLHARLPIVSPEPIRTVTWAHHFAARRLELFAIVSGVGLPRDHEHLADTDVRHAKARRNPSLAPQSHGERVPPARRSRQYAVEQPAARHTHPMPTTLNRRFRRIAALSRPAAHHDLPSVFRFPLEYLILTR